MTQKHLVYLALGTNLGERQKNLQETLQNLPPQVEISAVSRLYETAPAYVLDQPPFINIAAEGYTELSPSDLLKYVKIVEKQLGREKTRRFGPRKIDIDIIFYDDLVLDIPHLHIPHPRVDKRAFVLHPLAEIAPDFVHPALNKSVQQMLDELPPEDGILSVIDWQPLE
jgi:2-amino-4-hydroxy-6-hydroxymethyldihydropteridine diphosphokinase